jgi:oxysterol-binding protein-related protein 3/6/7
VHGRLSTIVDEAVPTPGSPPRSVASDHSTTATFHDAVGGEYELENSDLEASETDLSSTVATDWEDDIAQSVVTEGESSGDGRVRSTETATGAVTNGTDPAAAVAAAPLVHRRRTLPAPASASQVKIFSLLSTLKGKDLSRVAMPVTFNEPLSALQRLAEDFEYSELLCRANASDDPIERLSLVAAFAVSGFAATRLRHTRKPLCVIATVLPFSSLSSVWSLER